MFADLTRQGPHPHTAALKAGAPLRRLAAAAAAVTVALLASLAAIPAAFARVLPPPEVFSGTTSGTPLPAASVHAAATGGTAVWQITLIAVGAALAGAAVTVLLGRIRAARGAVPSPAA